MSHASMRDNLKYLEKIVKGFANHRRIEILKLLEKEPNLSLLEISEKLRINFKTGFEHVRKLTHAGLISKRYRGLSVLHEVTDLGKTILKFLKNFDR